ncbi:MAG TPA: polyprenyl synthetase family protein [Actinocrinis sp.]|jgi:heptaprenyl diphosphate synthase|uniref:polyprenyl synthetase family protein n=1 Tax=Actinocrinis sp. TaxID=1920516 RepID=UPI002DDD3B4C|nr:polyprenyl synthetase family protein [Actinocrinis sp.]HEV3173281.1 polyprenyl synthetase family protein [Actinocrinis sp.]
MSTDSEEISLGLLVAAGAASFAPAAPEPHWTAAHRVVAGFVGAETLRRDLECVEHTLRGAFNGASAMFADAMRAVAMPGKRLRPLLVLACGYAGAGPVGERLIRAAAAVELLHLGSLVHDDVMDESDLRHGAPSINERWGNLTAVLVGDVLLSESVDMAADLGAEQAKLITATLRTLCDGQARESASQYSVDRDEQAYLHSIAGKTARLIAASCRLGAIETGLSRPAVDALETFGHHLGMAFQIVDDVLDLTTSTEQLGKPAGRDIVQGVYALPVIHAIRQTPRLADYLGRVPTEVELDDALRLVRSGTGIGLASRLAEQHTESACLAVESCAGELDEAAVAMLRALAMGVLERRR